MIDIFYHIFDIYTINALSFDLLRASLRHFEVKVMALRAVILAGLVTDMAIYTVQISVVVRRRVGVSGLHVFGGSNELVLRVALDAGVRRRHFILGRMTRRAGKLQGLGMVISKAFGCRIPCERKCCKREGKRNKGLFHI